MCAAAWKRQPPINKQRAQPSSPPANVSGDTTCPNNSIRQWARMGTLEFWLSALCSLGTCGSAPVYRSPVPSQVTVKPSLPRLPYREFLASSYR